MIEPLVSVIIPFYSGKEWLVEAIESVINQTYHNTEILVVNDGSLEDISETMLTYAGSIRFINKSNGGPASARNRGIEESEGKYVAFLDSDDIWLEKKLEKQILYMEKNKSIWSQHSYEMFWENSKKTKHINTGKFVGNVYKDCFISLKIQTSCIVIKRDILIQDNIRFPLNKRYGEDSDFYKQLAKNYKLDFFEGIYSKFRVRGSNAGFRAEIQLSDRASVWEEINEDKVVLKMLPKSTIFAYKISSKAYLLFYNSTKKMMNKKLKELYAKFIYTLPYLLFKFKF